MSKVNVEPAFPTLEAHGFNTGTPGMTLRDYFAAKAMQGFCANNACEPTLPQHFKNIAADAHKMADAMMEARKS